MRLPNPSRIDHVVPTLIFLSPFGISRFWFAITKDCIIYRKHQPISRTFLHKIFVSNRGCGLSARTSVHHAINLHKVTLLKVLLTGLTLPFLSRQMSLSRESPFRHKVVYSVDDGCSLWQKLIYHERENTMLFSSILMVCNDRTACAAPNQLRPVWRLLHGQRQEP